APEANEDRAPCEGQLLYTLRTKHQFNRGFYAFCNTWSTFFALFFGPFWRMVTQEMKDDGDGDHRQVMRHQPGAPCGLLTAFRRRSRGGTGPHSRGKIMHLRRKPLAGGGPGGVDQELR